MYARHIHKTNILGHSGSDGNIILILLITPVEADLIYIDILDFILHSDRKSSLTALWLPWASSSQSKKPNPMRALNERRHGEVPPEGDTCVCMGVLLFQCICDPRMAERSWVPGVGVGLL